MKIYPTVKKGLAIDVEQPHEGELFKTLLEDAIGSQNQGNQSLAESLSLWMANDEDWQEFVVPELDEFFALQIQNVRDELVPIFSKEFPCRLLLSEDVADAWFGCLNQARIQLENRYELSIFEPEDDFMSEESEFDIKHAAYMRNEFYSMLQGALLEFVLTV